MKTNIFLGAFVVGCIACATSPTVEYRTRDSTGAPDGAAPIFGADSGVDSSAAAQQEHECARATGLCLEGKMAFQSLEAIQAEWDATNRILEELEPLPDYRLYVGHCFDHNQYTMDPNSRKRVPSEFGAVVYTSHPACPIGTSETSLVLSAPKDAGNTAKVVDAATSSSDDLLSRFITVAGALELGGPQLTKVGVRYDLRGPLGGFVEARLARNGHLITVIDNKNSIFESENSAASQATCEFYRKLD